MALKKSTLEWYVPKGSEQNLVCLHMHVRDIIVSKLAFSSIFVFYLFLDCNACTWTKKKTFELKSILSLILELILYHNDEEKLAFQTKAIFNRA